MKPRLSVFRILTACLVVSDAAPLRAFCRFQNRLDSGAGSTQLSVDRKMPAAVARHLKRFESIPGLEGCTPRVPGAPMPNGSSPVSVPGCRYSARLHSIMAERAAAAARLKGKGFPTGKGRPDPVGDRRTEQCAVPVHAVPLDSFGYVPNAYVASGRATALAIDPNCAPGHCRLWVVAAGGGVWRTKNALTASRTGSSCPAVRDQRDGSITLDPNDPTGNTLWVGTGEANASADCDAGVGHYKSTDGGDTWTGPSGHESPSTPAASARSRSKPGDPNTIYAGVDARRTRCLVGRAAARSLDPRRAAVGPVQVHRRRRDLDVPPQRRGHRRGLHACTNDREQPDARARRAASAASCSIRSIPNIVYAGSYARGVWRSNDGGRDLDPDQDVAERREHHDAARARGQRLPNGNTRMYVAEGATGRRYGSAVPQRQRATGAPSFTNLTSSNPANPGYGSYNYCTGQCWYDNFVVTPAGYPDIVYVGGSYSYGETGESPTDAGSCSRPTPACRSPT